MQDDQNSVPENKINHVDGPVVNDPVVDIPAFENNRGISNKEKWVAFILCFFLGAIGIHRFYVGKVGTGILYIFTLGIFGIGILIDLIMIVMDKFTDKEGLLLTE